MRPYRTFNKRKRLVNRKNLKKQKLRQFLSLNLIFQREIGDDEQENLQTLEFKPGFAKISNDENSKKVQNEKQVILKMG